MTPRASKEALTSDTKAIIASLMELRESVDFTRLELTTHRRLYRSVFSSFLKGIAYGLGALTAAALVIPIVLWLLSAVAWPPIIAGLVSDVVSQLESNHVRPPIDYR